jgi:hypothetical protein
MSREKLGAAAGRFAAINNTIPRVFTDIDLFRISMRSIYENYRKCSHVRAVGSDAAALRLREIAG